jgi:tetratricopeptide (TPR) repeat protein
MASVKTADVEALKQEGNTALAKGDHKAAHACYTRALKLTPDNHILFSNRAAANANMGEWAAALADSQRCIDVAPDWPKGHVRSGAAHYALSDYESSVAAYSRALELAPGDSAVLAAREDAEKAMAKKKLDAELLPAVIAFAQRKQVISPAPATPKILTRSAEGFRFRSLPQPAQPLSCAAFLRSFTNARTHTHTHTHRLARFYSMRSGMQTRPPSIERR